MSTQNSENHKNEYHGAGDLAKDPVTRHTPTGKLVANFTLCIKHGQYSEFVRGVAWEKNAEKVAKLAKGDFVQIVGRLATRSWDDKASGQKKYITEIVAFSVSTPGDELPPITPDQTRGQESRKGGTAHAKALLSPATGSTPNIHGVVIDDSEIPF